MTTAQRRLLGTQLQEFPELRPSLIKEKIAEGFNHVVYRYHEDQVIKLPKKRGSFTYSNSSTLEKDLSLIRKYFPHLAIKTDVRRSESGTTHCIIQDFFLDGKEISIDKVSIVKRQIEAIIEQNKKLYKETGYALDIVGGVGFLNSILGSILPSVKPSLSNLVMRKQGSSYRVYLLDIELLRLQLNARSWSDIVSWVLAWVSFYSNAFLLKFVFKF